MGFNSLSEVVIAYPPTNSVWKFKDIGFVASQSDFFDWPENVLDPWNRRFPHPSAIVNTKSSMGWSYITTVEGFRLQCLVRKVAVDIFGL